MLENENGIMVERKIEERWASGSENAVQARQGGDTSGLLCGDKRKGRRQRAIWDRCYGGTGTNGQHRRYCIFFGRDDAAGGFSSGKWRCGCTFSGRSGRLFGKIMQQKQYAAGVGGLLPRFLELEHYAEYCTHTDKNNGMDFGEFPNRKRKDEEKCNCRDVEYRYNAGESVP